VIEKSLPHPRVSAVEQPLELAEVYRAHGDDVMRWATRLLRHPQDAADVTQEVFFVVQRRLPGFSAREGRLTTWLFRITANVVRAQRRRERLWGWLFEPRGAVAADAPNPQRTPAELVEAQGEVDLVHRVLSELSAADRELLVLFELEACSGAMVAEILELPPATIWVRLHRARARFLKRLKELEPEADR
jgi:RNA polymerase sigma-70 factor (ECF subfamily)